MPHSATETPTEILGFFGVYRPLSNFHLCSIDYNGIDFPSAENAFQAAKCYTKAQQLKFRDITPREAKQLGRRGTLRSDWEDIKDMVMANITAYKFKTHPELAELLLSTGDKRLEETNTWGDTYWGVCNGKGLNRLGEILMTCRDVLREHQDARPD